MSRSGKPGLVFSACGELWAFEIGFVEKVARAAAVREIPEMPEGGLLGVVRFRDKFVPVYDFRSFLGCGGGQVSSRDRFVILKHEGSHLVVVVDDVLGLFELEPVADEQTEKIFSVEKGPVKSIALPVQNFPKDIDTNKGIRILKGEWFFLRISDMDITEPWIPDKDFG